MRRKKVCVLIILLCNFCAVFAQHHQLSGIVRSAGDGQVIIGATITIKGKGIQKSTLTGLNGKYVLQLPTGRYNIKCQAIGFQTYEDSITLADKLEKDLALNIENVITEKVIITDTRKDENISGVDIGRVSVAIEDIKILPAFMGEVDILKSLQLLPGVQSGGEGTTGLFIRGSGPDQNLVLLDGATLYNTGHLFGFFSVFNADAIESFDLYKGGMPAQFGGRLSSIVDFKMNGGNNDKWKGNGGIGLIASRLTLDGPFAKEKGNIMLSGRRTYIDILSRPFFETATSRGVPYYFYDFNGKVAFKLNDKNRLFLSGYTGRDAVTFDLLDGRFIADIEWGNNAAILQWKHTSNDKLFWNTQLHINNYQFHTETAFDNIKTNVDSYIKDYGIKWQLDWYPNAQHHFTGGAEYIYHQFLPREFDAEADDVEITNEVINQEKFAQESALFVNDVWKIHRLFEINLGLRFSTFQQLGPYDEISANGNAIDTTAHDNFDIVSSFNGLEPRIFFRFTVDSSSSVKAAFNVTNQYLHLLSISGNNLPFDIWVPSSVLTRAQRGFQYSIGYFRNFLDNRLESSIEVYYRDMINQSEYRQDFVPTLTGELEHDIVFGRGASYGLELFFQKKAGRLHAWLSYTLSKSERYFDDINEGHTFPYRFDRRHDLALAAIYKINDRWSISTNFVFGSGQPLTLPVARYLIEGAVVNVYGDRNSFRMPHYHRMDISVTYDSNRWKRIDGKWVFSIYNIYNRKNPYIIYIDTEGDISTNELSIIPRALYLFPILPSVSWNFSF